MLTAITAALQGLAALRDILALIKDLNLSKRLNDIAENQEKILQGHLAMAKAETPDELKAALRLIHRIR